MKSFKRFTVVLFALLLLMSFIGCSEDDPAGDTAVAFSGVTQVGGTSGAADSTFLTLTFSVDPTTLAASDITVAGATKGALSGTGTTRSLAISEITVTNGATISVAITDPSGFTISGSPKTAMVYKAVIGTSYQGGIIAYIFQSGDPGYVSGQTHGLIAAAADQSTAIIWAIAAYQSTSVPGTSTNLGSGAANTAAIVAQNEAGSTYAAGLCDAYINADTGTGVYSDWYLPSRDELNKLYLNMIAVGGFARSYYWSSSEYDNSEAWRQDFFNGYQGSTSKGYANRVRAVRAF